MAIKIIRFASPQVQKLVEGIRESENDYGQEKRQYDREKISLPVSVSTRDGIKNELAFSQDLSKKGISLISPASFTPQESFYLSLDCGDATGKLSEFVGECRWCQPLGERYFVSGWQIDDGLDVARILKLDASLHGENRISDRIQVAIPVVIHQKNDLATLQAFTRNISDQGACLVCVWPTTPGEFCLLDIVRHDGQAEEIIAECVWSRPFGNCFMSGWRFPRLDRIENFHRGYWSKD